MVGTIVNRDKLDLGKLRPYIALDALQKALNAYAPLLPELLGGEALPVVELDLSKLPDGTPRIAAAEAIARMVVVLPAPLRPSSVTTSPARTAAPGPGVRSRSRSTG